MHKIFLKEHYLTQVVPALMKTFSYKNRHQVPSLIKMVINSGVRSENEKAWIQEVKKDIALITGQQPVVTKARKSISNFKVRQGMPVGVMVTLRGEAMYEFFYRLCSIALPIVRDFRGVSSKLDGNGNYNMGIQDHTIFPEITVTSHQKTIGFDLCIVTSAKTDKEARELLRLMGMPFRGTTNKASEVAA